MSNATDISSALADSAETLAASIVRIHAGRRPTTGTVFSDDLVVAAGVPRGTPYLA